MKYISPQGLQEFKKELKERQTDKRKEIASRLEEAKALGDLAENTEYAAAKEIQAFNEGRILELEGIIRNAKIIRPGKKGRNKVVISSVIEVRNLSRGSGKRQRRTKTSFKDKLRQLQTNLVGDKQIFTIVGSHEAQPSQGKISNESPLGQAFLDHQSGDIIEVETPGGKAKYKIVSIK